MNTQLTQKAIAGDERAFEELVRMNYARIYFSAFSLIKDFDAAHDLAQEVFLSAWLNIRTLKSPDYFEPWLARITRNRALNWIRTGQRKSKLITMVELQEDAIALQTDEAANARESAAAHEFSMQLQDAVLALPAPERETILLHYGDGMSISEIAKFTGEHISTISRRLDRAHKKLREHWTENRLAGLADWKPSQKRVAGAVALLIAASKMPPIARADLARTVASTPTPRRPLLRIGTLSQAAIWIASIGIITISLLITSHGLSRKSNEQGTVLSDASYISNMKPHPISAGQSELLTTQSAHGNVTVSQAATLSPAILPENPGHVTTREAAEETRRDSINKILANAASAQTTQKATSIKAQPDISSTSAFTSSPKEFNVTGHVVDEYGNPISSALVTANVRFPAPHGLGSAQLTAHVQPDGSFGFAMKDDYEGTIFASARGLVSAYSGFTIPDSNVKLILKKSGGTVMGQVEDQSGKPVPNALVAAAAHTPQTSTSLPMLVPYGSTLFSTEVATSDAGGHFTLSHLPSLEIRVYAAAEGQKKELFNRARMNDFNAKVSLVQQNIVSGVVLKLSDSMNTDQHSSSSQNAKIDTHNITVTGQITDENGNPLAEAFVGANFQPTNFFGNPIPQYINANISPDGQFGIPFPPGQEGLLMASSPGLTTVYETFKAPRHDFRLVLRSEGASVDGKVVDSAGNPMANEAVAVKCSTLSEKPNQSIYLRMADSGPLGSKMDITDANGHFHIGQLPPSKVRFFAAPADDRKKLFESMQGLDFLSEIKVAAGESTRGITIQAPSANAWVLTFSEMSQLPRTSYSRFQPGAGSRKFDTTSPLATRIQQARKTSGTMAIVNGKLMDMDTFKKTIGKREEQESFKVRVNDQHGTPIPSVEISYSIYKQHGGASMRMGSNNYTDRVGETTINPDDSDFLLMAAKPGYITEVTTASSSDKSIVLQLKSDSEGKGASIEGYAVWQSNGKAAANCQVCAMYMLDGISSATSTFFGESRGILLTASHQLVKTDNQGTFLIKGLPPGNYRLIGIPPNGKINTAQPERNHLVLHDHEHYKRMLVVVPAPSTEGSQY